MVNEEIQQGFRAYDRFLSHYRTSGHYEALRSLKMMYALHMRVVERKKALFPVKQLLRLAGKVLVLPFTKMRLVGRNTDCVVLECYATMEQDCFPADPPGIVALRRFWALNPEWMGILIRFFKAAVLLLGTDRLKRGRVVALLHRLLDYYHVHRTLEFQGIKTVFMENDRFPTHKALIDKARLAGVKTVKFDYWLIDAINHNDVYCDCYFYPNRYHRDIIETFSQVEELTYISGGFPNFDRLAQLRRSVDENAPVVYFTQPDIPFDEQARYIRDIARFAKDRGLIVKVHPRDDTRRYEDLRSERIVLGAAGSDSYRLLESGAMFFSVFSTISLEAKHLSPYAFFINYDKDGHRYPVDYERLGLDLIDSEAALEALFQGRLEVSSSESFIARFNPAYPHTVEMMLEVCRHA